jgi:hypothetical protein
MVREKREEADVSLSTVTQGDQKKRSNWPQPIVSSVNSVFLKTLLLVGVDQTERGTGTAR